jgi:hypothetical protein
MKSRRILCIYKLPRQESETKSSNVPIGHKQNGGSSLFPEQVKH